MSTITEVHQPAAIGMRGHAKQLSSTDSKIKNIAKTAFQKIAAFFAYCQSNCKSAYATLKAKCLALKARITSFFKKSDSLSQPSQKFESFSGERDQSNSVVSRSRSPSPADGLQGRPGTPVRSRSPSPADGQPASPRTPVRSRSPSPVNNKQAQVSAPVSTPQTLALIPCQSNPFSQEEIYNRSLRSLVANNYELPSPVEDVLYTLHPFTLLSVNASQPRAHESVSPSPVNNQQAQVNAPELTPETVALVPHQPNPSLQALHQQSSNGLVANNCQIPSATEARLYLLQNSSRLESPVATGASVDAEPVLASAISFAQRQNRRNTPPFANVEQFSQLSPRQRLEISQQLTGNNPYSTAGGQTSQPSGSNVPTYIFGASAAVVAVAAVLKNDPALLTKLASGATTAAQSAQPVLAKAFEAATNGARTIADAVKSAVANAHFNNGKLEIDMA